MQNHLAPLPSSLCSCPSTPTTPDLGSLLSSLLPQHLWLPEMWTALPQWQYLAVAASCDQPPLLLDLLPLLSPHQPCSIFPLFRGLCPSLFADGFTSYLRRRHHTHCPFSSPRVPPIHGSTGWPTFSSPSIKHTDCLRDTSETLT